MATCYRHPDRTTGVSCSNCERSICPDCMTSTSVGMRCPECSRERTQMRSVGGATEPTLTYVLIGINVVVALGAVVGGASASGAGGGSVLLREGGLAQGAIADGEYWRLVTSGFLHFGLIHLLFNMFVLYILGGMLEPALGRLRFGIVYFVSMLAGSFGALLLSAPNTLTAGASGAVFGLMGAAVIVMRNRGINPMESGLGLWIGLNLLITFTIPGISIGGHIGGLLGGGLAALVMFDLAERVQLPRQAPMALAAAIGVLAVAGSIVIS
jgi:membrane associated rhomboid family serine protease